MCFQKLIKSWHTQTISYFYLFLRKKIKRVGISLCWYSTSETKGGPGWVFFMVVQSSGDSDSVSPQAWGPELDFQSPCVLFRVSTEVIRPHGQNPLCGPVRVYFTLQFCIIVHREGKSEQEHKTGTLNSCLEVLEELCFLARSLCLAQPAFLCNSGPAAQG